MKWRIIIFCTQNINFGAPAQEFNNLVLLALRSGIMKRRKPRFFIQRIDVGRRLYFYFFF